jgi:GDP-L-fucose synthase
MPTNLYGPGDNYHPQHSHVMAAMIRRFTEAKASNAPSVVCWGTGTPRREFMHVDDLASACVFALERWRPERMDPIQHLNVGTGTDVTIAELANMIATLIGYQGKIEWDTSKSDGTPRKLISSTRFRKVGWTHHFSLTAGLQAIVANTSA